MPLRLTEKQKEGLQILDDPEKTRVLFTGGSRSGKTVLICEYLVRRAYQFPGSRQLLARRALVDIRNSIWNDTLLKYLKSNIPDSEYDMRQSELRVIFKNGSELQLGGLDDEERMQKILGTEFLTIFC
ncbi:DNA-packaging protein, partial [Candidatus Nomurabacteria bacterium]|nr:DNA-packaging protein [Candidatus Nomurabacteria bacterium]